MKQIFFITGTDTHVGKTFIACRLLQAAKKQGLCALGLKPVAAGAELVDGILKNDDAILLQQNSSVALPYADINPWCFADPVAPHIAAQKNGSRLDATNIADTLRNTIAGTAANYIVIEGAGGWRVPLNASETLADVVKQLQIPVILVVGMKLGCINHALLTAEAIQRDGLALVGWIASDGGQPMPALQENITTLSERLSAPQLRI
jgi:dethiobiotin synthetase